MQQGAPQMHPSYMPQVQNLEQQQQALAYQNYVQQQQRTGGHIPQQYSHQA